MFKRFNRKIVRLVILLERKPKRLLNLILLKIENIQIDQRKILHKKM